MQPRDNFLNVLVSKQLYQVITFFFCAIMTYIQFFFVRLVFPFLVGESPQNNIVSNKNFGNSEETLKKPGSNVFDKKWSQ